MPFASKLPASKVSQTAVLAAIEARSASRKAAEPFDELIAWDIASQGADGLNDIATAQDYEFEEELEHALEDEMRDVMLVEIEESGSSGSEEDSEDGYEEGFLDTGGLEEGDTASASVHMNEGEYFKMTDAEKTKLLCPLAISSKMTRSAYDGLQSMPQPAFRPDTFPSTFKLQKRLAQSTKVLSQDYDMCTHGCRAFTVPYERDTACRCGEMRLSSNGSPRAIFRYLPLTDRLVTLFESKHMSQRLQYRPRRTEEEDVYHDVFDGDCFKSLIQRQVVWEDKVYPNRYFAASTDVALQLGLDGVQYFVRNGIDCWPIIITLFSLSPELRHRQECKGLGECQTVRMTHQTVGWVRVAIRCGLLREDLVYRPEHGCTQTIVDTIRFNTLRAHLLSMSGDMPAVAKVMHFRGHTAKVLCRCCTMQAINAPGKPTYYITRRSPNGQNPDYGTMPLRVYGEVQHQARAIEMATNGARANALGMESGIQGQAIIALIGSVDFPWSSRWI
ncbi:hypothetical protein NCC49_004370 [Naganishia albida]|nr:hypothetical protein NCC49_004370 [Naganishia albida]